MHALVRRYIKTAIAFLFIGLAVAGGMLQIAGLALYFCTMWSRIRAAGSQGREADGERF